MEWNKISGTYVCLYITSCRKTLCKEYGREDGSCCSCPRPASSLLQTVISHRWRMVERFFENLSKMLPIKELWNYSHRWPVLYPQQWQRRLFDFHQQNNMSVDTTATNLRRISSCCLPKKQCMVWGFSALKWRCRWCDDSLSSMKLQKSLNRKGCVCKEVGQLCLWRAACRARPDLFSVRWKQMLVLWVCPHLQACVRSLAVVQLMWGILLNSLRVSACKYWRR